MPTVTDLTQLTALQMADGLAAGEFTSVDLTQAHLDRIAVLNPVLNAFLQVDTEGALATAADVDARRAAGEDLHRLAGVPVAVKDIACTQGIPTTAGSKTLEGWIPPYDATIVTRIRSAGMPILGKTNMDEFAMGSSTEHSAFGPTRNPWDWTGSPAAPAAAAPPRSRPSWRRWRSARTRVVRSASPARSPARLGPSRPTAVSPATA